MRPGTTALSCLENQTQVQLSVWHSLAPSPEPSVFSPQSSVLFSVGSQDGSQLVLWSGVMQAWSMFQPFADRFLRIGVARLELGLLVGEDTRF